MKMLGQSASRLDARGKVTGKTLYPGDLNMANFTIVNPGSTNLILDSTGGSAIVTGSAADDWLSITATAQYNVVLSGDGDITTGNLESRYTGGALKQEYA